MRTAPEVQALYEEYGDRGFLPISLMTTANMSGWAGAHGLEHPVLDDTGFPVISRYVDGGTIGMPNLTLMAPGLKIKWRDRNSISVGDFEQFLPE